MGYDEPSSSAPYNDLGGRGSSAPYNDAGGRGSSNAAAGPTGTETGGRVLFSCCKGETHTHRSGFKQLYRRLRSTYRPDKLESSDDLCDEVGSGRWDACLSIGRSMVAASGCRVLDSATSVPGSAHSRTHPPSSPLPLCTSYQALSSHLHLLYVRTKFCILQLC